MTMVQPEKGATLESITRGPVTRSQIARFAAATGDFNPVHTDEAFARKIGFPSVIAHGPLTLAFLTQALGHNFGADKVLFFSERGTLIARSDKAPGEDAGRDFSKVSWVAEPIASRPYRPGLRHPRRPPGDRSPAMVVGPVQIEPRVSQGAQSRREPRMRDHDG